MRSPKGCANSRATMYADFVHGGRLYWESARTQMLLVIRAHRFLIIIHSLNPIMALSHRYRLSIDLICFDIQQMMLAQLCLLRHVVHTVGSPGCPEINAGSF